MSLKLPRRKFLILESALCDDDDDEEEDGGGGGGGVGLRRRIRRYSDRVISGCKEFAFDCTVSEWGFWPAGSRENVLNRIRF